MKFSEFLKKLQNQPIYIRKIILWLIVIILALFLFFWWVNSVKKGLKSFQEKKLEFPPFSEKLREIPKLEIPY